MIPFLAPASMAMLVIVRRLSMSMDFLVIRGTPANWHGRVRQVRQLLKLDVALVFD